MFQWTITLIYTDIKTSSTGSLRSTEQRDVVAASSCCPPGFVLDLGPIGADGTKPDLHITWMLGLHREAQPQQLVMLGFNGWTADPVSLQRSLTSLQRLWSKYLEEGRWGEEQTKVVGSTSVESLTER